MSDRLFHSLIAAIIIVTGVALRIVVSRGPDPLNFEADVVTLLMIVGGSGFGLSRACSPDGH